MPREVATWLKRLGLLAVCATGWRIWRTGALSPGAGAAYASWHPPLNDGDGKELVRAATLASNAHNTQPWRFKIVENRIEVDADLDRHIGSFDPFRREMHLSLGCAVENLVVAARAQGMNVGVALVPGRLPPADFDAQAATVRLTSGDRTWSELFDAIPQRRTHRRAFCANRPLPGTVLDEIRALVPEARDLRLFLFEGECKTALAGLIVEATRAILADPEMAADNARWFRFDRAAVERRRDGLTLDANTSLSPVMLALAKLLSLPSSEQAGHGWLKETEEVQVATAPLLGAIAVRDLYDRPVAVEAGRVWQRIHLLLTAHGLAAQPLNQPVECVDRERAQGKPTRMAEALARITGNAEWLPTFVFRAGYPEGPAPHSPRRPVESVLAQ